MRQIARLLAVVLTAGALTAMAAAEEPYCNGRPRTLRGIPMYPNGRPIQAGELVMFPNGAPTVDEHGTLLYPNGRPLVNKNIPSYPHGHFIQHHGIGYYPNRTILFRHGVFFDERAQFLPAPPREITMRWQEFQYIFDVGERFASQERIRMATMDKGSIIISFFLEDGKITNVKALCPPDRRTPTPSPSTLVPR